MANPSEHIHGPFLTQMTVLVKNLSLQSITNQYEIPCSFTFKPDKNNNNMPSFKFRQTKMNFNIRYKCYTCYMSFPNQSALFQHIRLEHENVKPTSKQSKGPNKNKKALFKCIQCGKSFAFIQWIKS